MKKRKLPEITNLQQVKKCGAYWDAGHLLRPFTGTLNSSIQQSKNNEVD